MRTKQMTSGAILSALLIVISVVFLGTGIGYSIYLDLVVPVFIAIIYLKCGFRYTVLAALNTLFVVAFGLGNLGTAIWMSQSLLVGLICGIALPKKTTIWDDLFYCSIASTFVLILIDIYAEGLMGVSLLKETRELINHAFLLLRASLESIFLPQEILSQLEMIVLSNTLKEVLFYILVASFPIGTIILSYGMTLLVGHRLGVLSKESSKKYRVLKQFNLYRSYMCLSQKSVRMGIIYVIGISLWPYAFHSLYTEVVLISIKYIVLYFIVSDAFGLISKYVFISTRSALLTNTIVLTLVVLLLKHFRWTSMGLLGLGILIDYKMKFRARQLKLMSVA